MEQIELTGHHLAPAEIPIARMGPMTAKPDVS